MIYIEEKSLESQLKFLDYLIENGDFECIVWFYPESKIDNFLGEELVKNVVNGGSPVTTYQDGVVVKRSHRKTLTGIFVNQLIDSKNIYKNNCDSCVVYKSGEMEWYASLIGHEGMVLVNDDDKLNDLSEKGFYASTTPPDWW